MFQDHRLSRPALPFRVPPERAVLLKAVQTDSEAAHLRQQPPALPLSRARALNETHLLPWVDWNTNLGSLAYRKLPWLHHALLRAGIAMGHRLKLFHGK